MTARQQNEQAETPAASAEGESRRFAFSFGRLSALTACLVLAGTASVMYYWSGNDHSSMDSGSEDNAALTETWAKALSAPVLMEQTSLQKIERETIHVVEELVAKFPNSPTSLHQMARLYYTLRDVDKAQTTWQQCLELDPEFTEAYYGLGYMAWEQSDYATAVDCFVRLLQRSPEDLRIPYLLGDSLMKQGRIKEAVAVLERNVRTQNASIAVLAILGQAYLQLGEYERAKTVFQVVLQSAPHHKQANYGLARAHARLGETEESQQCMEKFKTQTTKALREHGQQIHAFDDLESARVLLTTTYTEIGEAYAQQGLEKKAVEMWQRAAILAPASSECRTKLLQFYDLNQRIDEAAQVCQQLCQIEPGDGDHWHDLAILNGERNRWDAALEAIEKAIELAPENESYREAYDVISNAK